MFGPETCPPSQSSPGLLEEAKRLRPRAILNRLRPVRVMALHRRLQFYHRLNQGLALIRQYFPNAFITHYEQPTLNNTGWWEALHHLAMLAEEAGWFETNWGALHEAWSYWLEADQEENGDYLAAYLRYIPVKFYGFNDASSLFEYPPMELLHLLLSDCPIAVVSSDLLLNAELYDGLEDLWPDASRQAAWERLHEIEADPGRYPEPVRWLPELARWACHRTGNILLDRYFDPYDGRGPWLSWAGHLELVRSAWQRAQPVLRAFERLMNWYEADNGNLAKLADFIMMKGDNYDQLDW